MSNPNAQQAEPTMEEILASIRRIISEEAPEAKVAEAAPLPQPEPQPLAEPEEDILDLTDMVADAPAPEPVFAPQVATPPAPMPEPVVQQAVYTPPTTSMPATPPAPAPLVAANESDIVLVDNDMTRSDDDGLLSGNALDRAGSAFDQLSRGLDRGNADRSLAVSSGDGRTIEDMIREMLKPMLQNWLEDHLPEMVERVVREEVERASRRGRR